LRITHKLYKCIMYYVASDATKGGEGVATKGGEGVATPPPHYFSISGWLYSLDLFKSNEKLWRGVENCQHTVTV
jgi:hypothetical protein